MSEHWWEKLRWLFDRFPALEHAKQPGPLPPVEGSWSLRPEAEFAELVAQVNAGQSVLRLPPEGGDTLCGPFAGRGFFDPIFLENDWKFIDPTVEPQDGDFVVIAWGEQGYAQVNDRSGEIWRSSYARYPDEPIAPIATKRLRKLGRTWYLTTNKGAFPIADNRVLGVVRRVLRGDSEIYAPAAAMIEVGATFDVFRLVLADSTIAAATYPNFQQADAISLGGIDFDCDAVITLTADAKMSGAVDQPGYLTVQCLQRASGSPSGGYASVYATGTTQSYTARHVVPLLSGVSPVFQAFFRAGQDADHVTTRDLVYSNAALTVEICKR